MESMKYFCFLLSFARVWAAGDHCIWYGECGTSPVTGRTVNCYYNGTAKPFQSSVVLETFRQTCPDLYQGANTRTCCSDDQMMTLFKSVDVPKQLLGACSTCLHNFLNVYCYATCHPHNSDFIYPKVLRDWVDPDTHERHKQILEVDYIMTPAFAEGMYESCREVALPIDDSTPAIGILCGHSADECTAQNWLDYMGDVGNQQTPFTIHFNLTATSYVSAEGYLLTPANPVVTPSPCNSAGTTQQALTTVPAANQHSQYRQAQIVIERPGQHASFQHNFPPPSTTSIVVSPIFDRDFLHEVLALQRLVQGVTATHGGSKVTLADVCVRSPVEGNNQCIVLSVLSYFQDDDDTLDRVAMDTWGFYILADYLDHFLHCVKSPKSSIDTTPLHESCLGTFGGPVYPFDVLGGYPGQQGAVEMLNYITTSCCMPQGTRPRYETARELVLTWLLHSQHDDAAVASWEKAFCDFTQSYASSQPNMTLTCHTGTADRGTSLLPIP